MIMSLYRYILVRDLCVVESSFSKRKIMTTFRKEKERWRGERHYCELNNYAIEFFRDNRWRVVQIVADKIL